jgi:hypothetical protein
MTARVEVPNDFSAIDYFASRKRIRQIPSNFHNQHLSCANENLRSRFTLREEGQVARLESPNRLGATLNCQANKSMSIPIAFCFGHLSARRSVQRRASALYVHHPSTGSVKRSFVEI